jgi:hypothetical protein
VWLGAYVFANLGSLLLGAVGVCLIGLSSLLVLGFFVAAGAKPIAVARAFGVVSVVGLIASTIAIGVAGALSNAAVDGAALFFVNFISFCGATVFTFLLVGATNRLCRFAIESRQQAALLLPIFPVMIIICLGAAGTLSSLTSWRLVGPLLLFLGLLTLINAPFDWASLGVTRALLRRGLELGGWWPYLLAIADALLATVIIATLALAMVIGVQAFDGLAIRGGGTPILLLDPFFDGIMAHPTLPEYWWVYALLLSTVIPSLVNLVIGGASLLRGVPGLPSLLLCFMPAGKAVPDFERRWIALVLTLQIVVGAILGVAAQAFLIIVVIGYVMPWFGLGLLDMARDLAAFNLPLRVSQLLGGG